MQEQIERIPYATELSEEQWEIINPHIPTTQTNRGRRRIHPYRDILNAIFYLLRPVALGNCYSITFHLGKLSTIISIFVLLMEFWNV
jgi:hypothetical protein